MEQNVWSYVVFAACVIAFICDRIFGIRVLGLAEIVFGVQMLRSGRMPYGWRGRPASGYITGWAAVVVSLLLICLGALFVLMPEIIAPFFSARNHVST